VTGFWMKVEQNFEKFRLIIDSKIQRDVRTTLLTGDYLSRKVSKDTNAFIDSIKESKLYFILFFKLSIYK
jgi:hypothetical protein